MKLPVLFIGHGSPMNAIEPSPYADAWAALGQTLRAKYPNEIKAVLAVSAHWCTARTAVTAMDKPRTIHDFGGFPQALFDMRYPADGSPALAARIRTLLGAEHTDADTDWGLDHGTWGVLVRLFPEADIPVVQLGLNVRLDFAGHFAIGRKLAALREKGVLIMASGNIVHNLRLMDRRDPDGAPYPWAESVQSWVNRRILAGDTAALADERRHPADFLLAAPTPEHYWPLLYALGAADGDTATLFNDGFVGKSLSMTSAVWEAA